MRCSLLIKTILIFTLNIISFSLLAQGTIQVEVKERRKDGNTITFKEWKKYSTNTIDSLSGFTPSQVKYSKYGFIESIKGEKTGFFHTQKINGRWWVIDPEGNAGINILVNDLQKGPSDKNKKAYTTLYKSSEDWITKTIEMLQEYGFNGAGSWSDQKSIKKYNETSSKPFSYTIMLNWMSGYGKKRGGTYQMAGHIGYPNQCIFVFDPEFEEYCMEQAKLLKNNANDSNLIGYFSDNELPLSSSNLTGYLNLPETDPGYKAATNWLKQKGIKKNEITEKHKNEFAGVVADKYYSTVSKAIKKHDPNHMYLGSRLYAASPHTRSIIEACGRYADIITINYYNNWEAKETHLNNWKNWTDTPFQVTEFYTKSEDSGLPNTAGAGWVVRTQKDRGYAYQHFCMSLLKANNCVGWHWFKYMDNDPDYPKAEPSNTDSNKGMVDNQYKPYTDMLVLMKELNSYYVDLIQYFSTLAHNK